MSQPITRQPVSYESRLALREPARVDTLVIHCTELPGMALARQYAEQVHYHDSRTGACGHYYIDKDGALLEYVSPGRVAHHCVGCNERSVGIELDNLGRYPDWLHARHQAMTDPYPDAQIDALLALIEHLLTMLPQLRWMAGHEELDVRQLPAADDATVLVHRKRDPGPLFPWSQLESAFENRLLHGIPAP